MKLAGRADQADFLMFASPPLWMMDDGGWCRWPLRRACWPIGRAGWMFACPIVPNRAGRDSIDTWWLALLYERASSPPDLVNTPKTSQVRLCCCEKKDRLRSGAKEEEEDPAETLKSLASKERWTSILLSPAVLLYVFLCLFECLINRY